MPALSELRAGSRRLAFPVLVLLHLVPVWAVRYPASCDGPAHLESARALLHRASSEPTVDREYLALRRDPSVSWFAALVLAGLMLGASPEVALKLFMSGCLLVLAGAVRHALTAVDRESGWLSFLALPLLYNTLFLYGFYSFLYGLAVLLFTVGAWLRLRGATPRDDWRLTGLALALQFTHLFCLLAALITLAALGVARALTGRHEAGVRRALASHVVATFHAFLPALTLAVVFLLPRLHVRADQEDPAPRFLRTFPMISYGDPREGWLAGSLLGLVAVTALLVAIGRLRRRRFLEVDGLLAVALFWLAFWLGAPERIAHGSFLSERAALCLLVTALLWCASHPLRGPARAVAATLAVAVALGLLGVHLQHFREVSRQVDAYVAAASNVATGSVLLPLGTSHAVPPARVPFLEHAASYVAIERNGINLGNYQFAADHFPLTFRRRPGTGRGPAGPADVVLSWDPANVPALTIERRTTRSGEIAARRPPP